MNLLWLLLALPLCFVCVIAARALAFRPEAEEAPADVPFEADEAAAAAHLQAMLRLKTVSDVDPGRVDLAEFERFRALLPTFYPHVFAKCVYEEIGAHGMLLRWPGEESAAPAVLMAHYDVVPAVEAEWTVPPFDGVIRDGELWGRGALDTKCTLLGVLEAAEKLIQDGFVPKNDVYFAFGGDEECMGGDARLSVGILARALAKLEARPMPFSLTRPARELFNLMGRHSTFAYKLIFANLWCFAPLLNLICQKSGGEMNALVRTTCALTRLSAADAYNVLPGESRAGVNLRVICGDTVETAKARMERIIDDPGVRVRVVDGSDPSPISPTGDEPWNRVSKAIRQPYPGVLVAPYLMLACSDSRHYCRLCEHVYRFSGMPLTKEQRGMIHGANERIPLTLLSDTVRFFGRVLLQC